MQELHVRGEYIKLGQALKAADIVETGGEAKDEILAGLVRVNGEICTQRGKKLYPGDEVSYGEEILRIL